MNKKEIYKHINITHTSSCFDYIDSVFYDEENGTNVILVFIEPVGTISFTTKLMKEEDIAFHLNRVFNNQPVEMDYIDAGWTIHSNESNILYNGTLLEYIDTDEYWNDKFVKQLNQTCDGKKGLQTIDDLYLYKKNNDTPLYFRLGNVYTELKGDVHLGELTYIKPLNSKKYLCLFNTTSLKETAKELNIFDETNPFIIECILDGNTSLENEYIKQWNDDTIDSIKKEIQGYEEFKSQYCYDEYLDKFKK